MLLDLFVFCIVITIEKYPPVLQLLCCSSFLASLLKMKWAISAVSCRSSVAVERLNSFWKLQKNWATQAWLFSKLYSNLRISNPVYRKPPVNLLELQWWSGYQGLSLPAPHFGAWMLESTYFCCHNLFMKPKQYRNNIQDFSQELSGKVPIPVYRFFS